MSDFDGEDDFEPLEETNQKSIPKKSPFGTESDVDYLVYRPPSDSPELRSEATYIPVAPKLQIRDAAPIKPQTRVYSAWTPGDPEEKETKPKSPPRSKVSTVLRFALIAAVSLAPIIVVLLVTRYALSLYSGQ